MRTIAQLAIIAVLGAGGYGAWTYWPEIKPYIPGLPQAASTPTGGGQPRGGGAPFTVEVMTIRTTTLVEKAEAVGTARANESLTITAKQSGNVARIAFDEGQAVKAGQILIELDTRERRSEVDQARNELEQARAVREDARQKLERGRQLKASGAITQAKIDELDQTLRGADARVRGAEARIRTLDARLDDVRITAPFDGRVGLRQVSLGTLVQPGAPVTTLDDLSRVKLDFSIPENYLGKLREGLAVHARTLAFPTRVFEGRVTAIDTRVDPVTRAVRVNALFDNSDEALKPGMFISVELALDKRDNAVIVPEEALVPEGARQYVFIVRDNRAIRVEIKLGTRIQGEVEVLDGVKIGEQVIVRGTSRVRPNMPVTARPFQRPAS